MLILVMSHQFKPSCNQESRLGFGLLRSRHDIYNNAAMSYFAWLLPYAGWLLTCGMSAPSCGYATCSMWSEG